MKWHAVVAAVVLCAAGLPGCAPSNEQILASEESQVKLRGMQTRAFDTTDRNKMLRTVIATMQDLGFVIDSADEGLGTVTGTKVSSHMLRLTVTVRPRGTTQLLVRASAQHALHAIEEPGPYQNFFASLEKSLFLTAHQVD